MWPTLQQPWYFSSPRDIAEDSKGFIYVSDQTGYGIVKFSSDGTFISSWKSTGDIGQIVPFGIAINDNDEIFLTNDFEVLKCTTNGELITKWGLRGSGNGEFSFAKGLAVGPDGNVYVTDCGNNRIQKFSSEGNFIKKWGTQGSGDGEFEFNGQDHYEEGAIAIDAHGNVYVADTGNYRIQKFTSDGTFLAEWGKEGNEDGEFTGLAGLKIGGDGNVYVTHAGTKVSVFTPEGSFLYGFDTGGAISSGIFTDADGHIYISDLGFKEVRKFSMDGQLVSLWSAGGVGDGEFYNPHGVVIDDDGNIVVCETNDRIQKFTPEGRFIEKWAVYYPLGIAKTENGNFYVTSLSGRVYKLNSKGEILDEWGSTGTEEGQFNGPYGIAVDGDGNVYVADEWNHNIQKFTSDGTFIASWGTYGDGDGQFGAPNGPTGLAVDAEGNVFACDPHNGRIQKFASDGRFLEKWTNFGSFGSAPYGIAIDRNGFLYVCDLFCVVKLTANGELVSKWGSYGTAPDQMAGPNFLAVDDNKNKVFVVDDVYSRVQVFKGVSSQESGKAIILAGGGPFPGNNLWDSTQMVTNFAYRALTYQGFTKETIYYLSSDTDLDLDNNGVADDVDGDATKSNLQNAITSWAKDADSLLIYLSDHGGDNTFRMSGTETLAADDLNIWLNQLQSTMKGRVTIVYDACESGSFLETLSGSSRTVITSTSPGQSAYFATQGSVSFSNYFWTHIFNGVDLESAFKQAKEALEHSFQNQTPLLDADGDGTGNEDQDYTLVQNTNIGNGTVIAGDAPVIESISPTKTINNTSSAELYANATDSDGIARVWAIIRSPDYNLGSSDNPVTALPSIDLMPVGDDRYEAVYEGFNIAGTYRIAIYARDRIGNTVVPEVTTVSVSDPLRRKAIVVAGGSQSDPIWPAIRKNTGLAHEALTFQGYNSKGVIDDDIYFMSPVSFSTGVDGLPTLSNLEYAITDWGKTSTQDVVLYMVGDGENGTFKISETETLQATSLNTWLNTLQQNIQGKITVIYDACQSGTFLSLLKPPSEKERILISSTGDSQAAYFLTDGDISFSRFFWGRVLNGENVREAFLQGKDAIAYACTEQTPQMDDNGNGLGNEKADGILARDYTIGVGIMLAGDDPLIGSVSPSQSLSGETSATLWAEDVTTTGTIDKVWAVITSPGYSSDPADPVTDLPTVELNRVRGNRFEGTYDGFNDAGTYNVAVYAMDGEGTISLPKETSVLQPSGSTLCSECTGDPVVLKNVTFASGTDCECRAETSITIGPGVKIESGAKILFIAPDVNVQSGFHAKNGSTVNIRPQ